MSLTTQSTRALIKTLSRQTGQMIKVFIYLWCCEIAKSSAGVMTVSGTQPELGGKETPKMDIKSNTNVKYKNQIKYYNYSTIG